LSLLDRLNAVTTPSPPPNPPCIRRGGQWLNAEDLQAHLAALLRLENVGVLLGSGSSLKPLDGLTMAGLWEYFTASYPDSFAWMAQNSFLTPNELPNVEKLADAIEIAALEWQRAQNLGLKRLKSVRADLQRAIIHAALLDSKRWETPGAVDPADEDLRHHRAFLQKLTAARQPGQGAPWIFTTNYDLALEWAAESISLKSINGFDGLHRRSFSPHNFDLGWRNVLARGEARFGTYHVYLVKVHGSLSWHELADGTVVESPASERWPVFQKFLEGDSDEMPSALVLPSAAKYLQTVGFVLGELFRRLADFLARPQTCLITNGYSFSDEHLNRLLISALQNPTLQLVIYLPKATRRGDALELKDCSPWVRRLLGLESPQVTIVGGGARAYFDSMEKDLPDPAVYDEQAAKIRRMLRELKSGASELSEASASAGGDAGVPK
jgi:uncharacterized protein YciI